MLRASAVTLRNTWRVRTLDIDFNAPSEEVARQLIGARLLVDGVGGLIVETEAYDAADPASHSHSGLTVRNAAMFGPPGHAYVYRSYGLHWCLNLVCREAAHGAGVLIRAMEPEAGLPQMLERRGVSERVRLCRGPGCVGQALGITDAHNGMSLASAPFELRAAQGRPDILVGVRVGISKAVDRPWRFGLAGSACLSWPFK